MLSVMTAGTGEPHALRRPRRLVLALFGVSVVVVALGVLLAIVAAGEPLTAVVLLFPVAYLAFAAVGALVLVRQPGNLIGWFALATGVIGTIRGVRG